MRQFVPIALDVDLTRVYRCAHMYPSGELVKKLREERGWDQDELADRTRISRATISVHENGHRPPSFKHRRAYAEAFGFKTVDEFDRLWRASRVPTSQGDPDRGIPVINRAPAGEVIDYEEYGPDSGIGHDYIKRLDVTEDAAFAVQVVGDSMVPVLAEGDVVVFAPLDRSRPIEQQIADGAVVFVRFGPDARREGCTIAQLFIEDDRILLRKENPKYPPLRVKSEELQQVAVMVDQRRKHNFWRK